jgi:DNA repair exonuclease SbcCD ATPase subunit/DNA repair exonuclease SbcCD nuclease subunit
MHEHKLAATRGEKSKLYDQMILDGIDSFTMTIVEEVSDILNIKRAVKLAEGKYINPSLHDPYNLNTMTSCRTDNDRDAIIQHHLSTLTQPIHYDPLDISHVAIPSSSVSQIDSIIHISDIHIRAGNHDKSRYTEYLTVFNNLFHSLAEQVCITSGTSVIVITGDLFHHKNKLEPYGLELALHLLRGLAALAPVFVIRGNHDYRQDIPKERDMISALMSYQIPYVSYLDKTGVYTHKNLSFGLVAIQDTLLYGATTGIAPDLPPFPKGSSEYNVALFHGTIAGCTLQTGQSILHGYPIDWFQDFDAILLGDIHLQQVNRVKPIDYTFAPLPSTSHVQTFSYDKESPWGYPGSLVQQDFGEPIFGHGYFLWNLKEKQVHAFHVHNPYGFVKMKNNEIIINKKHTTITSVISENWFPHHLKISVLGTALDLSCFETKHILFIKSVEEHAVEEKLLEKRDIKQINSLEVLTDYVQNVITKNNKPFTDSWKSWLKNPEQLIIDTSTFPEVLAKKISDRSDKILKASSKYLEEFEKFTSQHLITGTLHIHTLQWNWILNYRDGNIYDFDTNHHKICIVNAKNGSGKSNFLEVICIALFGEGFPSRENPNYTSGMICDKKPAGTMANTSIIFSLNDKKYILQRVMRPNSNARNINFEKIILSEIVDGQERILHQQKGAVHPWIETHIGTLDAYLMTAMLSQNTDRDFFTLDKVKQRTLLDRIMSLDHINSLKSFLKDTDKYYKYCSELIETYYDGAIGGRDPHLDKQLTDCLASVTTSQNISSVLHSQWNHVSERDLVSLQMVEAQKLYTEWTSTVITDLSVLDGRMIDCNELHAIYSKTIIDYHSFSDIVPLISSVESYSSLLSQLNHDKQQLEEHPYYKSKSLYELCEVDEDSLEDTEHPQLLFDSNKEFETWDTIKRSEYAEVFDDSDLVVALNRCSLIVSSYPSQIAEVGKQIKVARKKYLMIRKQKDELSDKRPNRPSKSREWLSDICEKIGSRDTDYISYLEGFLMESVKQVPMLSMNILNAEKKCQEMSLYLSECAELPFNPKCKSCAAQPWKKTVDMYTTELPLLQRSIEQMRSELTEYIYEDIPFDVSVSTDYLQTASDILLRCTEYLQTWNTYSSEMILWNQYDTWSAEYDSLCQKHDIADKECDTLDTLIKGKEVALVSATLEKQMIETKIQQIKQKKTEYDLYCTERSRRLIDYEANQFKLETSWFHLLSSYHTRIGQVLWVATEGIKSLSKEKELIRTEIMSVKDAIALHKRAAELRSVMEAYPHWMAWKTETEKVRSGQLLIRELETRSGNKVEGVDIGKIKEVMEVVSYLSDVFDGYREWLYQSHIAPLIEMNVNQVLSVICEDRPLRLEGEWLDKIETLSWFVRDGSSRPVIEKASGFQRFIVGMACRVAFHQIGFCRIVYDQLFIDEGFTSCDSDNLERVPDFLRSLLRLYNSIYLATHLDELKVCADSQIMIDRDASGLSQIQSSSVPVAAASTEAPKKKGRPSKKVTVVRSD